LQIHREACDSSIQWRCSSSSIPCPSRF